MSVLFNCCRDEALTTGSSTSIFIGLIRYSSTRTHMWASCSSHLACSTQSPVSIHSDYAFRSRRVESAVSGVLCPYLNTNCNIPFGDRHFRASLIKAAVPPRTTGIVSGGLVVAGVTSLVATSQAVHLLGVPSIARSSWLDVVPRLGEIGGRGSINGEQIGSVPVVAGVVGPLELKGGWSGAGE